MARELPGSSPFAGDDGAPDPDLSRALAAPPAERVAAVVRALPHARVLVPVVAELDQREDRVEIGGGGVEITGEKQASAALVSVATADGRGAMPIFSGIEAVRTWRRHARPIPVPGAQAALAAVTEADGLLILDPGGRTPVLIPRPAVWAVAQGHRWVPPDADDRLLQEVQRALQGVDGLRTVELQAIQTAGIRVVLGIQPGLARAQVNRILEQASDRVSRCDLVAEQVDSLQFRVRACYDQP